MDLEVPSFQSNPFASNPVYGSSAPDSAELSECHFLGFKLVKKDLSFPLRPSGMAHSRESLQETMDVPVTYE